VHVVLAVLPLSSRIQKTGVFSHATAFRGGMCLFPWKVAGDNAHNYVKILDKFLCCIMIWIDCNVPLRTCLCELSSLDFSIFSRHGLHPPPHENSLERHLRRNFRGQTASDTGSKAPETRFVRLSTSGGVNKGT